LAHSKSALKRWRQSLVRRDRNRSVKSQTRTLLNKAVAAIQDDPSSAEEAVRAAVSALDRAAQKNVIHDNAAARGKSRLLKRYNLATATAVAAAAGSAPAEEAEEKPARRGRASAQKPAARGRAKKDDAKPAARRTRKS
jgi:small subunit ribosomal protein S20